MGPGPVFTPPIPRGAMGHGPAEFVHGPGAMGTIGGWPQGPWHPAGGGRYTREKARRGLASSPLGSSPTAILHQMLGDR